MIKIYKKLNNKLTMNSINSSLELCKEIRITQINNKIQHLGMTYRIFFILKQNKNNEHSYIMIIKKI